MIKGSTTWSNASANRLGGNFGLNEPTRVLPAGRGELFTEASGGATLHQLRHSALMHHAEDGTATPMLMARSSHTSARSLVRAWARSLSPAARSCSAGLSDPLATQLELLGLLPGTLGIGNHRQGMVPDAEDEPLSFGLRLLDEMLGLVLADCSGCSEAPIFPALPGLG